VCTSVCEMALEAGFRHIDSAHAYKNEAEAGVSLRSTKCKREDIFFTTKIPQDLGSFDDNYASLLESVRQINGGNENSYVDLFLIHSARIGPEGIKNVWTVLEKFLREGMTRRIGVSNFTRLDIEGMKEYSTIWPPHVNQIQARYLNPWIQNRELLQYCQEQSIIVQAYSPLTHGLMLDEPIIEEIAQRYRKSPAQVLIRYCLQKGWVPLTWSVHRERIEENTRLYDFDISDSDLATLDSLN
ncbi:putative aldo-keto reductase, partial [Diaporthe sp. PMI_573]